MAGDYSQSRSLENTATWAIATVCFIFVIVSFIGERGLHYLGHWLVRTKRKPLIAALEKMKEELMLLGFISLIITVTAEYISDICVKESFYNRQLMPCKLEKGKEKDIEHFLGFGRGLNTFYSSDWMPSIPKRKLAAVGNTCKKGYEPFISFLSLEQLHRFLFVMGVTHVFYSSITVVLAILKVHCWKKWEIEAHQHAENQEMAELTRTMTMKRQSTFVEYHSSGAWSRNGFLLWVVCFFRQFGHSVTKSDYLALRMGFTTKHHTGDKYDFHSYMVRSLEDDFKDVVGISPLLWLFVVVFMLLNIHGINFYFWIALLPVVLVVIVGAKLQNIIAHLALESSGLSGPLTGVHLRPRDELFWFRKPHLLLYLIHFILFQDAFELATFLWGWWQFGWHSCMADKKGFVYARVLSGFVVQVFCSYSTLPLYAIVTQMGSRYKAAIFQETIVDKIHRWHKDAKHHHHNGTSHGGSNHGASSEGSTIHHGSKNPTIIEMQGQGNYDEDYERGHVSSPPTITTETDDYVGQGPTKFYKGGLEESRSKNYVLQIPVQEQALLTEENERVGAESADSNTIQRGANLTVNPGPRRNPSPKQVDSPSVRFNIPH